MYYFSHNFKKIILLTNSAESDQMPHIVVPNLVMYGLLMSHKIDARLKCGKFISRHARFIFDTH